MRDFFVRNSVTIAVIGSIASIIAIPLSVILFVVSIRTAEISYSVEAIKIYDAEVRQQGINVIGPNGEKIANDIYAYKILIWNSGSAPIDSNLVRQFPVLDFSGSSSLISVQDVQTAPNSFVEPNIKINSVVKTVSVEWKHLDPGNGIRLSILYSSANKIQPRIYQNIVGVKLQYNDPPFTNHHTPGGSLAGFIFSMGAAVVIIIPLSFLASQLKNLARKAPFLSNIKMPRFLVTLMGYSLVSCIALFFLGSAIYAIYKLISDTFFTMGSDV